MQQSTIINFNQSEAHGKLLSLLGVDELQIDEPLDAVVNHITYSISGTGLLFSHPAQIFFTEARTSRNRTLELTMETTEAGSLLDLRDLLELNPYYDLLYHSLQFPSIKLTARASEGYDLEYLTIQGKLLDDNTLLGFIVKKAGIDHVLTDLTLTIHISHRKGSLKKRIRATIAAKFALGDQSLNVELSIPLQNDEIWTLRLLPPGVSLNIKTLLDLGMEQADYEKLPPQVTTIPDFRLNSLSIDFDPSLAATTKLRQVSVDLGVGDKTSSPWIIWGTKEKPVISLQSLGLRLNMYWDRKGNFHYSGQINGIGKINSYTITATIPIPLEGIMTLEINGEDPNKPIPSLNELGEGMLDGNLDARLPEGEMTKFALYLNRLRLAIDLGKDFTGIGLEEFELDIRSSTDGSWIIWKDHIELNEFGLNFLLKKDHNPTNHLDSANNQDSQWQTSGTLYGKGKIQDSIVALRLHKPFTGPWEIALTEPLEFSLPKVLGLSGQDLGQNTGNVLPAKLDPPESQPLGVRLRNFKLRFQREDPKFPYLGLYIETTGTFVIIKDKLALSRVFCILEIRASKEETSKISVEAGGTVTIGKHPLSLAAKKINDDKGWEYQGKTEPGDAISLNDLLGALLKPLDVTLPASLPQISVKNIELYYAPKIRQVTFKGAAQINITDKISTRFSLNIDSQNGEAEKDQFLIIQGAAYIDLCNASFLLTAAFNSKNKEGWRFTGRAYDKVLLVDLLRKMLAGTVLALPDVLPVAFTLKKAKFEIAPTLKYYLLSGAAELTVTIAKLTVDESITLLVALEADFERPAVKSPDAPAEKLKVKLKGSALLEIIPKKASLQFSANYNTDGKGWLFSGELKFEPGLKFGELVNALGELLKTKFNLPEIFNKEIPLNRAGATIDTAAKKYKFYSDFSFAINKHDLAISTWISLSQRKDKSTSVQFGGNVALGKKENPHNFNLFFNGTWLLAAYSRDAGPSEVDLGEFINDILNSSSLPSGLTLQLNQAMIAYHPAGSKDDDEAKTLFLIGIGNGIDLSNLPMVSSFFQPDQKLKLNYEIQYASEAFEKKDIQEVNLLLKENTKAPAITAEKLEKGFDLSISLQIGDKIIPIDLNLGLKDPDDDDKLATSNENREVAADRDILQPKDKNKDILEGGLSKWFSIQKSVGSLYFSRIGIGYKDDNLLFMLDASFSVWGLTVAMAGLTVKNPLTKIKPAFSLDGLGIDYKNDAIEVGGSFLKRHIDEQGTDGYNEYDGLAVIKIKTAPDDAADTYQYANESTSFCISAIGSYAYVDDAPSLFIYAALNMPIGGPSFFTVTGLSAGFGYNRTLVIPDVKKVIEFPLLAETLQGKSMPANADRELLLEELQVLHQYIPPAKGQLFLAIGVSFTTYELIDSSVLLVASFGNHFELILLGISTLIVPSIPDEDLEKIEDDNNDGKDKKKPTRLANITLLIKGSFVPSQGFVGIQGVLAKKSYILSKDCKLSGGFALFAWFKGEHKGDFVATIGGYHPHFKAPAHYPKVPRVGFKWKLSDQMLIKGDMYFALCAHAFMAGGLLEATYESDNLKAWFKLGADFLLAWAPYHYEASAYIDIGCSYTFEFCGTNHLTLDIGAEVDIWGPNFGGKAILHLWIFSIDVDFGDQQSSEPDPIEWKTFAATFLPQSNLCSMTVSKGLVTKGNTPAHLGVLNPKELAISTEAFIPIKTISGCTPADRHWNDDFGIGSMNMAANQVLSSQAIRIKKTSDPSFNPDEHFNFTAITKKAPAGLWGTKLKPAVNDDQFIENVLTGVSIEPKKNPIAGAGPIVKSDLVKYESTVLTNAVSWEQQLVPVISNQQDKRAFIDRDIISKNPERTALMKTLGLDYLIELSDHLGNDLITEPVIIE